MNNYGRRPSFRERIANFMAGRYGADRFYYFLIAIYFILVAVNLFFNSLVLSLAETAVFIYAIYRVMSRNIYKRQAENEKYIKATEKPKRFFNLQKCKYRDRKTHVYKKCPYCSNNLRLPKQKGKHTVACPCCKNRFETRI